MTDGQGERARAEQRSRARIQRNFRSLLRRNALRPAQGKSAPRLALPLIPKEDMHGFALWAVIAIMSFLAVMTAFAAHFIGQSAQSWGAALRGQAVVQIMPVPGQDMETALRAAANIARSFGGVDSADIISRSQTQALLAPWLGAQADIDALPVPRLIALKLSSANPPDSDGLKEALRQNIQGARFDGQDVWAEKLAKGAHIMLGGALAVLGLVLTALTLTVVFATRGALAGNMPIIEVLHFIGADDRFIARQFDAHFFRAGLKGASCGGAAAACLFAGLYLWFNAARSTSGGRQMAALFGRINWDFTGLAEIALLIICIAALTMASGHFTVMRLLRQMDKKSSGFFISPER